jgi:hypothetical protein
MTHKPEPMAEEQIIKAMKGIANTAECYAKHYGLPFHSDWPAFYVQEINKLLAARDAKWEEATKQLKQSEIEGWRYAKELEANNKQLREDAGRYQFIKNNAGFGIKRNQVTELNIMLRTFPNSIHDLDAAIDAAMKETT